MSDRSLRLAAGLVALAGLAVAGYLTWVHFDDAALVCVAGGGCETVQESEYAEIAGIPVAMLGLGAYAVASQARRLGRPERTARRRRCSHSSDSCSACTCSRSSSS